MKVSAVFLSIGLLSLATPVLSQGLEGVESLRNQPYAGTDNPRQMLDLYLPKERGEKPLPVVVYFHGGGWRVGGKGIGKQLEPFVASGQYAGVSVGYRLTDEVSWPGQIHDCKAAIRWIHANAKKYGLDANRIGVFGTSAGGHLVAMLGTTIGDKALEGTLGPHPDASSAVTCVVDFYGPTELLTMGGWHDNPGSPESKLVGGTLQETREVANQASPINHVTPDDVPFLILHGTADKVVPIAQSEKFHAALQKAGVESAFYELPGGEHDDPFKSGKFDDKVRAFFDRHLRGVKPTAAGEQPQPSPTGAGVPVKDNKKTLLAQKRAALRGGIFTKALWNGKRVPGLERAIAGGHLTGLNVTVRWRDFELEPGWFDWEPIDEVIQLAEKHDLTVALGIFGGVWTPDWAYENHRLPAVEFKHTKEMVKHAFGRQYRVPHVWEPDYENAFMAAVEGMASRYDSNPRLVRVFVSGPSFFFNEYHIESWLAEIMQPHGFTERKYIDGWKRALDQYAKLFPHTPLDLALVPFDGRLEPLEELINHAVAGHSDQVVFSNHSLNDRAAGNAHHPLAKLYRRFAELAPRVPIGFELAEYQMSDGASFSHPISEQNPAAFAKAVEWAIESGAWFIHPEADRLRNPANAAVFQKLHAAQRTHIAPVAADVPLSSQESSRVTTEDVSPAFTVPPSISPNPNRQVPLAALVRFAADRPVESFMQISDGQDRWILRYDSTRDPGDGLPVLGMRPSRRHTIEVAIRDPKTGRTTRSDALEFITPPLPEESAEFPEIVVDEALPDQMEPGITLLSVRRQGQNDKEYGLLLAVDAGGEVVWYYRTDARISDFQPLRNGNIVYITHDFRAIEIDLLGNTVASWYAGKRPQGPAEGIPVDTLTFHHEIDELPSGNLLVLGSEVREIENYRTSERDSEAPRKTQKVMGDEIIEFQRDGKVAWRWNAFDHLDPHRIGFNSLSGYWAGRGFPNTVDWTHGNGLDYDERDDSLIVSLRMQDALLKLDRATGNVVWVLGDASDWPETLAKRVLRPEGQVVLPWHQHAPSITSAATVMIFNNVNFNERPFRPSSDPPQRYSRAVEYKLNPREGEVQQAWSSESAGPEALLSMAMGDADLLPKTGNVLVTYGANRPAGLAPPSAGARPLQGIAVREFTKSRPDGKVWQLALRSRPGSNAVRWIAFGADRLPSLQR